MNCLQVFRRQNNLHLYDTPTKMANPTSSKLGKRGRSRLQRTVSRDSLNELNKLNLPPVDSGGGCSGKENCPDGLPLEGQRLPNGNQGDDSGSIKSGLRVVELNHNVEVGGGKGGLEDCTDRGRLLDRASTESRYSSQTKKKWWAIGSRGYAAAATSLPHTRMSPESVKRKEIPASPQRGGASSKEVLVNSCLSSPPRDMEIVLNDASPKWTTLAEEGFETDSPLREQTPKTVLKQRDWEESQEGAVQAQKHGARGFALSSKELVSERLHHARRVGGTKMQPQEGGCPCSPTLRPIVYLGRQDSGPEVLSGCGTCRKMLDFRKDIFMYGGQKAFCSVSCRAKAIAREEREEAAAQNPNGRGRGSSIIPNLWI